MKILATQNTIQRKACSSEWNEFEVLTWGNFKITVFWYVTPHNMGNIYRC
jgi:hypothetical protein